MNDHRQVLLHLSLIDGIGPVTIDTIAHNKPEQMPWFDLYTLSVADVQHVLQLSASTAQALVAGLTDRAMLDTELSLIEQYSVSWITYHDDNYPDLLKHIYAPPIVLYYKGILYSDCSHNIAMIGSRKANHYAQRVIDTLVSPLIEYGWNIVSGGALGADSMAHRAALDAQGKTVAVLGSGLLQPYPRSNEKLFDTIVSSEGCLVSPFPLMMQALPGNFPARNRIIAGLSRGCVVIQAAYESGARITAQYALEQGRDAFAVPGPIDDDLSAGCHALIAQGATLVQSADDIVQEYGQVIAQQDNSTTITRDELKEKKSGYEPNGIQAAIIHACTRPCSIEELSYKTQKEITELHAFLIDLQLQGIIEQDFAGRWSLVR